MLQAAIYRCRENNANKARLLHYTLPLLSSVVLSQLHMQVWCSRLMCQQQRCFLRKRKGLAYIKQWTGDTRWRPKSKDIDTAFFTIENLHDECCLRDAYATKVSSYMEKALHMRERRSNLLKVYKQLFSATKQDVQSRATKTN